MPTPPIPDCGRRARSDPLPLLAMLLRQLPPRLRTGSLEEATLSRKIRVVGRLWPEPQEDPRRKHARFP
eukprot:6606561-Pyramimonas_sp.AAC.1